MALAECGRTDVRCVTYTTEGDDEHVYAREFCRRLGLSHSTVSLDQCDDMAADALTRFFTETPLPGGDLAQIAVALVLGTAVPPGSAIVEGTGNDTPFGYMPYRKDRIEAALTIGRWDWADQIRARVPPGSILNYVLRDPAEINWPGLRVRHSETRSLFAGSVNTARVWRRARKEHADLDGIDFRALLRGHHFENGCQRQKVDLATYAFGQHAVYPYQDGGVIDYYFNLPENERYDRRRMVNKVHLRELLRARLDYDERAIGKRCFRFDGAAFVKRHRDFIADEIRTCRLFDRKGSDAVLRAIDIVDSGRDIWHHIVGLFQFAAWYNHSRYLNP
jgi:asparagine synthase (glutamine-hydrolysing)